MNPMDRPGCSRESVRNHYSSRTSIVEIIDLDDDEECVLVDENIPPRQMNNDQKEDANDSMQQQLEVWRNYGKRKLSKLEFQHEDDIEFYGFAATLLNSDKETMKEFQDFIDVAKKDVGADSGDEMDSYDNIDTKVMCLMDCLLGGRSPELKGLFAGVCIWVNGWTYPVAEIIHKMVALTGGEYVLTYSPKVTHIIATVISMSNQKIEKHKENTVNPEWVLDSLTEGRLLPLFDYRVMKPKNDIKRMFMKQYKKNRRDMTPKKNSVSNMTPSKSPVQVPDVGNGDDDDEIDFVGRFPVLKTLNKTPSKSRESAVPGSSAPKVPKIAPQPGPKVVQKPPQSNFIPQNIDDIDVEFLEALPPEIAKEIRDQYGAKNVPPFTSSTSASTSSTTSGPGSKQPKFRQQTLTFNNPAKGSNKAMLPVRKSSAKPGDRLQDQPKIDSLLKKQKDNKNSKEKILELFYGKMDRKIGVNLAGLSDVGPVISLLEEWILTYEALGDEDAAYVLRFVGNLVDLNKNDELFEILFKVKAFIEQRTTAGGLEVDSWRAFFYQTLQNFLLDEPGIVNKIPKALFTR